MKNDSVRNKEQQSDKNEKSCEAYRYIVGGFSGGVSRTSGGKSVSIFKSDRKKVES